MTGDLETPSPQQSSSDEKATPESEQPDEVPTDPSKSLDTAEPGSEKQSPHHEDHTHNDNDNHPAEQPGVFSAWPFDVNAVAGNIGGFFTSTPDHHQTETRSQHVPTDPSTPPSVDDPHTPADDIGATAETIAKAATAELEHASKAAQETFGKAAQEIGKGWGSLNTFLDDILAAKPDDHNDRDDPDVHDSFHNLFPHLDNDDQVVDHFKCTLLQKYRCYLNNATPEKTYPLRGRLFVTTSHIAMYVTEDGDAFGAKPFGIAIPFQDVGKIQKGAKAMLRLVTKSQSSYIFADFESDSHYSGALSLLEHMKGASAPPLDETAPSAENGDTQEAPATD